MNTNKIFMEAKFDIYFKEPITDRSIDEIKDRMHLDVGGFDFVIQEKSFPFDFESWSAKITGINRENNTLSIDYFSGDGGMIKCDNIDFDIYKEYYDKAGFTKDDINAGILASVSDISEFYVSMTEKDSENDELIDHIVINEICFIDENDIGYYASKPIIDNFNSKEKHK